MAWGCRFCKKNLRLWQLCQFCYVLNKTLWKIYWNQNTNQDLTCLIMASTLHFRYLAYFFRKRNSLSRGFFRDWKRSGTITKSLFLACCAAAHKRQPQASCFSVASRFCYKSSFHFKQRQIIAKINGILWDYFTHYFLTWDIVISVLKKDEIIISNFIFLVNRWIFGIAKYR